MADESVYLSYALATEAVPPSRVAMVEAFIGACAHPVKDHAVLAGRVTAFWTTVYNENGTAFECYAMEALSYVGFVAANAPPAVTFTEQATFSGGFCACRYVEVLKPDGGTVGAIRDAFLQRVIDECKRAKVRL